MFSRLALVLELYVVAFMDFGFIGLWCTRAFWFGFLKSRFHFHASGFILLVGLFSFAVDQVCLFSFFHRVLLLNFSWHFKNISTHSCIWRVPFIARICTFIWFASFSIRTQLGVRLLSIHSCLFSSFGLFCVSLLTVDFFNLVVVVGGL